MCWNNLPNRHVWMLNQKQEKAWFRFFGLPRDLKTTTTTLLTDSKCKKNCRTKTEKGETRVCVCGWVDGGGP